MAAMAAMHADERSVLRPVCAVNLNRVVISTHSTPLQMAVCMQFRLLSFVVWRMFGIQMVESPGELCRCV